jgi:hypothetical protein
MVLPTERLVTPVQSHAGAGRYMAHGPKLGGRTYRVPCQPSRGECGHDRHGVARRSLMRIMAISFGSG